MRGRVRLLAVLLALVAACAPTGARPAPHATGDVVLRVAAPKDLANLGVQARLIHRWDAAHPHVKVEIVDLPGDTDRTRSQLAAALQSGNPDRYDIAMIDVIWTEQFAAQHLIAPLDGQSGDGFWPRAWQTVRYHGRTWAVPWFTDAGLLYYRADLLGTHRLTVRTWSGLRQAAQDTGAGRHVDALVTTQLAPYEGLTVNAFEQVWRHGGEIVDGHGRVRVHEAGAGAGLEELADGISQKPVPLFDPESLHATEMTTIQRFLTGKVLAMRNWPFALSWLEEDIRQRGPGDRARYGVTTLPGPTVLGGWNLALVQGTGHPALARELIGYLTSSGAGRCLAEDGYVPARRAALDGPCDARRYLTGSLPPQANGPREIEQLRKEQKAAVKRALERARPRPATPYYTAVTLDIQDVMGELMLSAQKGQENVDHSTADLARRLGRSLKGH